MQVPYRSPDAPVLIDNVMIKWLQVVALYTAVTEGLRS